MKLTKWTGIAMAVAASLLGIMLALVFIDLKFNRPTAQSESEKERNSIKPKDWLVITPNSIEEYLKQVPESYIISHMKEFRKSDKNFLFWHISLNGPKNPEYRPTWIFNHFYDLCVNSQNSISIKQGSQLYLDIMRELPWYPTNVSKNVYIDCQHKYIGLYYINSDVSKDYFNQVFFEGRSGTVRFSFHGNNWPLIHFAIQDFRDFDVDFQASVLRKPGSMKSD